MFRFMSMIVLALLTGCATNVRFTGDELPSGSLTGEKVCEVPQHWKALALQGVDTQSLTSAVVVQVKVPPEWIGDALGWFVEGEETRTLEHYPRYTWQALVVNQHGKKRFFPAVMKNPLVSPVLTVIIPSQFVLAGEEVNVYVPSGAYTKLLTTAGEMLRLPQGKDCLGLVDAEFVRSFPSRARVLPASKGLIASIRADFPLSTSQDDGLVYSHSLLGFNERVSGDLRQVRQGERIAERGLSVVPTNLVGTGIGVGVTILATGNDEYVGPFGERLYSAPDVQAAMRQYLKGFNTLKERLEFVLKVPFSGNAKIHLDFTGRRSGWEIAELLAPQVKAMWEVLDPLKERYSVRIKEKGDAMKEATPGLLPSGPPKNLERSPP